MIRHAGIEPHVIEYLKTPPARALLASLIERMGVSARSVLREKGTPFHELGLDDTSLTDAQLLDTMMAHPIHPDVPVRIVPCPRSTCACSVECRAPSSKSRQYNTGRCRRRLFAPEPRGMQPSEDEAVDGGSARQSGPG
jgi:arsenate reductase (glutaredoxin)